MDSRQAIPSGCVPTHCQYQSGSSPALRKAPMPRLKTLPSRLASPKLRLPSQDKARAPHYGTAAHREWSASVIARAGYRCEGAGPHVPGKLYADHIQEIADGGDPLALSNGQALCAACHGRKTARARMERLSR